MTKNWSLKEKRIGEVKVKMKRKQSNKGVFKFVDEGFLELSLEPSLFYTFDDIKTLRKKLIEDCEKLDKNEGKWNREYNWLFDVKRIINKRFGVKDNAKSKK